MIYVSIEHLCVTRGAKQFYPSTFLTCFLISGLWWSWCLCPAHTVQEIWLHPGQVTDPLQRLGGKPVTFFCCEASLLTVAPMCWPKQFCDALFFTICFSVLPSPCLLLCSCAGGINDLIWDLPLNIPTSCDTIFAVIKADMGPPIVQP